MIIESKARSIYIRFKLSRSGSLKRMLMLSEASQWPAPEMAAEILPVENRKFSLTTVTAGRLQRTARRPKIEKTLTVLWCNTLQRRCEQRLY
jgi:hypothetical protein